MTKFFRRLGVVLSLALFVAGGLALWQRQELYDWWRLRNYNPPRQIISLANTDGMNSTARRIFYVNHPRLDQNIEVFHQRCPSSEKTIVLGCYHSPQAGIYIYDVTDNRLKGVEEITAAHEMLHAAYDRLGTKDKNYINGLLNEYAANLENQRLISTIDAYRQTEPTEVVNEMHSIFGTEAADLPVALENYYKRYFNDRASLVNLAKSYEQEFTQRTSQIEAYDKQLAELKQTISVAEQDLDSQQAEIQTERTKLENLRASGQVADYNAAVPGFNARINAYNQSIARLQRDIASYNQLVIARNQVANELRELTKAIDTRLTTQPVQ